MTKKFKLTVVGDFSVGKSSLINYYVDNKFAASYCATIGVDFKFFPYPIRNSTNDDTIIYQLWDTAGQERFRAIGISYYRGSHAIAIIYDVTNSETEDQLKYWFETLLEGLGPIPLSKTRILVIGNKSDKGDQVVVSESDISLILSYYQLLYNINNMFHFRCSAKTGHNVKNAFNKVIDNYLFEYNNDNVRTSVLQLDLQSNHTKNNTCCN